MNDMEKYVSQLNLQAINELKLIHSAHKQQVSLAELTMSQLEEQ